MSEKMTFENFVEDKSNRFALAVCMAVAEKTGEVYNPVWLYGPSGCGKTHLLNAVCEAAQTENRDVYFAEGIEVCRRMYIVDMSRERLDNCDVLVIDNIDFVCGKNVTQLDFAELILSKRAKGQQVIITSTRPPKDFSPLHIELSEKSGNMISVDMGMPTKELCEKIAQDFLSHYPFEITDGALEYLTENAGSVSLLQGALKSALFYGKQSGKKVDLLWIKRYLETKR